MTSANTLSILKGAKQLDARWALALRSWIGFAAAVIVRLKGLAPYALIELILPGGSVVALVLWLYRRRKRGDTLGQAFVYPVRHFEAGATPGPQRYITPALNIAVVP